jgi:hypothetical protein
MNRKHTVNSKKSILKLMPTQKATKIFGYKYPKDKSTLLAPISLNIYPDFRGPSKSTKASVFQVYGNKKAMMV